MDSQIKKSTKNPFDQLPEDILLDILSRLPIKSLIQFTLTGYKPPLSNSLTRHPHLLNLHLTRSNSDASNSLLIIHADSPILNSIHFLQFPDNKIGRFHIPFADSMPEFSILGSSNGLLCLINSLFNDHISLYNPFTRDYFELPKNNHSHLQIAVHGFGFDPVYLDYKVVKIVYYRKQGSEVKVYSRQNNMWLDKGFISYRLEEWSSPGVLVGHNLHWVSVWGMYDEVGVHNRVIISYNLVEDTFLTIKCPWFGAGPGSGSSSCHLAALNGCLCASVPVPSGCGSFDIWMMKDNGVEKWWVKEYSVGAYYPVSMFTGEMRNRFAKKVVKVLCVLKGGEVVLEYRGGGLIAYDPCKKSFKELEYEGMPGNFQVVAHVGSLVSPTTVNSIDFTFKSVL